MYSAIQKIVRDAALNKYIYGIVLAVEDKHSSMSLTESAGYLSPESSYYIASINKMMLSALALRLIYNGELTWNTRVLDFVGPDARGILIRKGTDVSANITVKQLISHTSGFPCYLIDEDRRGHKHMQSLLNGQDEAWPLDRVLNEMRQREGKFSPGDKKANYSETNFRLLASVLQQVTGTSVNNLLEDMFRELGMNQSFVLPGAGECAVVRYKKNTVPLSRYWAATGADVASTAGDQMRFLRAFFEGYFFPEDKLPALRQWKKIFFPFDNGVGLQRLRLPKVFYPFSKMPSIEGHCGSTGSFAFCIHQRFYVTGTVNQACSPDVAVKLLMKLSRVLPRVAPGRRLEQELAASVLF